ncbi:hypothetical protein EDD11_004167 [Mortierella claussenii]|nr:hypothetical protein EDD11_004167 [Mortierella claussenii]
MTRTQENVRLSWGPGTRAIAESVKEAAAASTASSAATKTLLPASSISAASTISTVTSTAVSLPQKTMAPSFIPADPSSQDPSIDYWRVYQDHLNRKLSVSEQDLIRLFRWLRSKPITNESVRRLRKLIGELSRHSLHYSKDVYNDFAFLHIKRGKMNEASEALQQASQGILNQRLGNDAVDIFRRNVALKLAMYLKSGQEEGLKALITRQGTKGGEWQPTIAQFLTWTKGLQLSGDHIEQAKATMRDVQDLVCSPNSRRFTHLLTALFDKNRPLEAFALVNHILDLGFPSDDYTTSCVMSGLLKAELFDEAAAVWARILKQQEQDQQDQQKATANSHGGVIVLNSLLAALCKTPARFPAAVRLWNETLQNTERVVQPDERCFASMLGGYFRAHDPREAIRLWEIMQQPPFSIQPNPIMYNIVLTGLFHNRLPNSAKQAFEEMMARMDREVSLDTYNIMIKGLLSVQDGDGLNCVMNRMKEFGVEADITTYTLITDVIFSQHDAVSAMKVTDLMTSLQIPKTVITYSAMVAGLANAGMLDRAKTVFEEMQQAGYSPTIHAYGAMMQGAFKVRDVKLAEEMATLAKTKISQGLSPGAYSILVSGYVGLSRMDEAEKWFMEFRDRVKAVGNAMEYRIGWKTYYVMLKSCVEQQKWEPAGKVLDVMEELQFQSKVSRLSSLIQEVQCARAGENVQGSEQKL